MSCGCRKGLWEVRVPRSHFTMGWFGGQSQERGLCYSVLWVCSGLSRPSHQDMGPSEMLPVWKRGAVKAFFQGAHTLNWGTCHPYRTEHSRWLCYPLFLDSDMVLLFRHTWILVLEPWWQSRPANTCDEGSHAGPSSTLLSRRSFTAFWHSFSASNFPLRLSCPCCLGQTSPCFRTTPCSLPVGEKKSRSHGPAQPWPSWEKASWPCCSCGEDSVQRPRGADDHYALGWSEGRKSSQLSSVGAGMHRKHTWSMMWAGEEGLLGRGDLTNFQSIPR